MGQGLVAEVATLQLHYGQQINSVVVLLLRMNFKNGQVRLDQMSPSFFLREQPIALVEVRSVQPLDSFLLKYKLRKTPQDVSLVICFSVSLCGCSCMLPIGYIYLVK